MNEAVVLPAPVAAFTALSVEAAKFHDAKEPSVCSATGALGQPDASASGSGPVVGHAGVHGTGGDTLMSKHSTTADCGAMGGGLVSVLGGVGATLVALMPAPARAVLTAPEDSAVDRFASKVAAFCTGISTLMMAAYDVATAVALVTPSSDSKLGSCANALLPGATTLAAAAATAVELPRPVNFTLMARNAGGGGGRGGGGGGGNGGGDACSNWRR